MIDRQQVAAHLEFFRELGVEGISRDPVWRRRPGDAPAAGAPGEEARAAEVPVAGVPAAEAGAAEMPVAEVPAAVARAAEAGAAEMPVAEVPAAEARAAEAEARAAEAPVAGEPEGDAPRRGTRAAGGPGDRAGRGAPASAGAPPGDRAGRGAPASAGAPPGDAAAPPRDAPGPLSEVAQPVASGAVALSMFDQVEVPAGGSGEVRLQHVRGQLGPCTRCRLHEGRTTLVFGVGNPDADLLFVGEAPGRDEDREGIPFVGRAGQLLTRIIEAIDLRRDDVYIANVIKCRPPDNRNPEPDEVQTCEPFLFAQIDCIRPRVIVALGSFAARTLLRDERASITKVRGKVYSFRGAQLIPTFHPAFLLRSPDRKREVWEDMKLVRSLLRAG